MGCGRSRHRSPSPVLNDGSSKENSGSNKQQRGAKRQKLADKSKAKSGGKQESDTTKNTPTKTTNGKMGGVKSEWQVGGERVKNDWQKGGGGGGVKTDSPVRSEAKETKRQWQLEEAVDTPPETVMAVYRSSVSASARASLNSSTSTSSPSKLAGNMAVPPNGSLLNGSHKATIMPQDVEMRVEVPEKSPLRERNASSGNAKPVHITNSQLEFFRMLDEKIEKGPDYESDDD